MSRNFIDITGKIYGDLTILEVAGKDCHGIYKWRCRCKCGTEIMARASHLKSGNIKGCGCESRKGVTHGESGSHFWNKWTSMRGRCNSNKDYIHLTIEPRWDEYLNFKKDMYKSYLEHLSIHGKRQTTLDRIDGNEGYSKSNCRWATYSVQNANRGDGTHSIFII